MNSVNLIRHNFSADAEIALNTQVNLELTASYAYQSMALYFDRHDVALPGLKKFFQKNSEDEHDHAKQFMDFLNKRGGCVTYADAKSPKTEWSSTLEALEFALQMEKNINQSLLDLHAVASKQDDTHLTDFLEEKFLDDQVQSISKLGIMITRLKRAGPGLGEYLFDKELENYYI
jgi:ferritin heavy chain